MGSPFELTFSYRAVSIDVERTGEGVTSAVCDERDSYDSCAAARVHQLDDANRKTLK